MTEQETQRVVAAWRLLWPSAPWRAEDTRLALSIWTAVLRDVDAAEAEAVLVAYAREGNQYPPTPGQIAERVLDLRDQRAGLAAPDVDLMLREVAHYRGQAEPPPDDWWTHEAILSAVSGFSWEAIRTMTDTTRAHLIRAYEAARTRHREERRITPAMQALLAPQQGHTPQLPSST